MALLAVGILSVAATLPLAFSAVRQAAAATLITAHERTNILDALHSAGSLRVVRAADPSGDAARLAVDGDQATAWTGRPGEMQWQWMAAFAAPVHLSLLRARFGISPTSGVPIEFRWETRPPPSDGSDCATATTDDDPWVPLETAAQTGLRTEELAAQPTRRSWFVDADACALRLVVDRTNAGPPVVHEVEAIEGARDVLRDATASDDGTYPGFIASDAIDGTYARRWVGAPGKSRWSLRLDLRQPRAIDRIRLVLGFDATSVPRPNHGRSYAIAWAPVHYLLEGSEDGRSFAPIASEPLRPDGSPLPLRRRLITISEPRKLRILRLVMSGATGASGLPEAGAVPVVREISAYAAADTRPILAAPWLLSINANPSAASHLTPGAEVTNDAYWAKFLQRRMAGLLPALRRDDRFARALGPSGEPLEAPPNDEAGQALESIEADDPLLDAQLLSQSSPPPIAVLSGSDDWDYGIETGPDRRRPKQWFWNPLRGARAGGIGQLAPAVRQRVAPFVGFCGGAQILALLEARSGDGADNDQRTIDLVLRRTSGRPIRGFAPPLDLARAWPGEQRPRAKIQFLPNDPLFVDLAGATGRSTTQSLPESHSDAVRPDAFLPGGPLQRFEVVATSAFCGPDVVAASARDGVFPNPSGPGWCDTVPEAFRSRDRAWPIVATQFHAEQKDFAVSAPGDPTESVADPLLFLSGVYESMVDAYVKLAP